ncbi:hypothetical protein HMPREF0724_11856 [Prescottella equi ATCC 33707]|uniref:Uncharacterized protein n=1 Tax=Prescottella equi ATCC 33707 TaxID=525370 RepID=F1TIY3_RHOHA|nr:hypothetical protein HMPREF0724_11856 [Prescottella equi ATCC 33707]
MRRDRGTTPLARRADAANLSTSGCDGPTRSVLVSRNPVALAPPPSTDRSSEGSPVMAGSTPNVRSV